MTFEELVERINAHDVTHIYSDDNNVWKSGIDDLTEIKQAAKNFPTEQVAQAWNAMVDRRVSPGYRQSFYWKITA